MTLREELLAIAEEIGANRTRYGSKTTLLMWASRLRALAERSEKERAITARQRQALETAANTMDREAASVSPDCYLGIEWSDDVSVIRAMLADRGAGIKPGPRCRVSGGALA